MATGERYVHALRFERLNSLYDPVVALTTRERAFKSRVIELAAIAAGEGALDLACGTGTLAIAAKRAQPGARVAGVDGDPEVLARARRKAAAAGVDIELTQGLSTDLPYERASFDVVVSTLFFHHLTDDDKRASATELVRVLRPHGRVVIADWGRPHDPIMRAAFLPVRLLDGLENTRTNASGALPSLLEDAGLREVGVADRLRTPFGTMELLAARAP